MSETNNIINITNNIDNLNINSNSSSINFINIDMPESTYDVKSFYTNDTTDTINNKNNNDDSLFDFILF